MLSIHFEMDIWIVSSFIAIAKKGAMNICIFVGHMVSLGKYLRMEWLDCMVGICLTFKDDAKLFSKVVESFYIPTISVCVPDAPHSHQCL